MSESPFTYDVAPESVRKNAVFLMDFHKDWLNVYVQAIKETKAEDCIFISYYQNSLNDDMEGKYHSLWCTHMDKLHAFHEICEVLAFDIARLATSDHPDVETRWTKVGATRAINSVAHLLARFRRG